jgi:hypothetical protein
VCSHEKAPGFGKRDFEGIVDSRLFWRLRFLFERKETLTTSCSKDDYVLKKGFRVLFTEPRRFVLPEDEPRRRDPRNSGVPGYPCSSGHCVLGSHARKHQNLFQSESSPNECANRDYREI